MLYLLVRAGSTVATCVILPLHQIVSPVKLMALSFQLSATDDGEAQEEKEEEQKMKNEKQAQVEEEKERIVHTDTLWSKLSEMAVDTEDEGTWESQDRPQGSSDVEANQSFKSEKKLSDFVVNLSNDGFANVTSSNNSTVSMDCGYVHLNFQIKSDATLSGHSEQSLDGDYKCNIQSISKNDFPLHTKVENTCSHAKSYELTLEKQVKELNSAGATFDSHNEDFHVAEIVTNPNSDGKNFFGEISANLLGRDELLSLFKMLHMKKVQNTAGGPQKVVTTVGLVS